MKQYPESVNVLGRVYKIIYVDKPCDADVMGRTSLWGQIDHWTRTIRVYNKDVTPETIFEVILHEIIHGIVSDLRIDFEKMDDEDIVSLLSLGLADVFLRNGWVELKPDNPWGKLNSGL